MQGVQRAGMLAAAWLCAAAVLAQQDSGKAVSPGPAATRPASVVQDPPQELGQGESLLYIGRKLWFETRKRLNLASEEELKAEVEEKKVKLRLGSFKIER